MIAAASTLGRPRDGATMMHAAPGKPASLFAQLLVFRLGGQRFALLLRDIDRIIRVVELTALPGSPHIIRGLFSLHGRLVPVADPRRRLGLPERELDLSDRIVVTGEDPRILGLLIGNDSELVECAAHEIVAADRIAAGSAAIDGIARLPDGLVLIHDLAKFLSAEEEASLAEALHDGP